jgi:hypothetical protein
LNPHNRRALEWPARSGLPALPTKDDR